MKQVTKCLRRRLAWCNRTGQQYDPSMEQYSILPRGLSDCNDTPNKGSKSTWTAKLRERYPKAFPEKMHFIPDTVIIDSMFLINTNPRRQSKTIGSYGGQLYQRFVEPYYRYGAKEVHLVFDNPNPTNFNPKLSEQMRRDAENALPTGHTHSEYRPSSIISTPWSQILKCRTCKRSIVEAIGLHFLQTSRHKLCTGQTFVLGGCFQQSSLAFVISADKLSPQPEPDFASNAQEADMRVWRHAVNVKGQRLLYTRQTQTFTILVWG